jgi:hypothetical protein
MQPFGCSFGQPRLAVILTGAGGHGHSSGPYHSPAVNDMKHRLLVATMALAAGRLQAQEGADGAFPEVHFLSPERQIVRGVRCATPPVTPEEAAEVERVLAQRRPGRPLLGTAAVNIPIVFHVIHDGAEGNVTDEQVQAQVQVLNDAYTGSGFSFTLQAINRVNNRSWFRGCYSNRQFKRELAVDPTHTLNFYTCRPRRNILGYAFLPWSFDEADDRHGVVVLHSTLPGGGATPYDQGDTGTHEVGHYLGLLHTFDNACRPPGDQVADTPAERSPAYGCPTRRNTCLGGGPDPITNFMDYTDDACMFEFSPGQHTRMDEAVAAYKPGLLN